MTRSALRAAIRIGWRSIRRSRGRSSLVVVMVLLPVAAMAAAITLAATVAPTGEASATRSMGTADYFVQPSSRGGSTDGLRDVLPDGAVIEPTSYDDPTLVLPGREIRVNSRSANLDGLALGMLTMVDGRQPVQPDEVAVSISVAELAGIGIGDQLEIRESGPATVVGLVEDPFDIHGRLILEPVSVAEALGSGAIDASRGSVVWLVALPTGAGELGSELDEFACGASGEDCLYFAVSRIRAMESSNAAIPAVLVLGGLFLVEALLIASAAFAVGVRRRQRELGLMAATGAERRHLSATVLGEGALLGGLGALLGLAAGVGAIAAASPWLDDLTNRRNPPVTMDAIPTLLAGGLGLLACLIAAALPARAAAGLPVLAALSGRRPPLRSARRILMVGIALIALGTVLTATGAAMRLGDPIGALSILLMAAGAIVAILGFGATSPWLIERLEPIGRRLPPAMRLALRDTARARSRSSPIVTAILAAFAVTVALSASFASVDARIALEWRPWARSDQIMISGEGAGRDGPEVALEMAAVAGAPIPTLVTAEGRETYISIEDPEASPEDRDLGYNVTVGDMELLRALGAETASDALGTGSLVLLARGPVTVTNMTVVVRDTFTGEALRTGSLPVAAVVTGVEMGGVLTDAVISRETAARLGLRGGEVWTYVVRLDRPVTEDDVARAGVLVSDQPQTFASAALGPPRSGDLFRLVLLVVSLLFALSVTAIGVALGEVESRPDQRTLLALGADPAMRRRIAAARAGVVALIAGVLAVPAGLLPAWGLLGSRNEPLIVPIPEVLAAIVILPLAGMLGALVLSPLLPSWSAFRESPT